jgi:hypothetical protein
LLATSSVAALLVGCGTPAFAACYTGPFAGGYTNSGATACITVNNTSFTGTLGNTGTISPGPTGIAVVNHSTITGQITDSGTISASSHGILIDNSSAIRGGGTFSAVAITGPTFAGGISNAGTITAGRSAIVISAPTFLGGISNSGIVFGSVNGIQIRDGALFSGGISNGGTVSTGRVQSGNAIAVSRMATFLGGIQNSGIVSGTTGIVIGSVSTFTGGISNSGTISAFQSNGISLNSVAQFVASGAGGGITNTGSISAAVTGISVYNNISTFSGGIANAGTISAVKRGIGLGFAPSANKFGVVSNFNGNISNSGTITSGATGIGILASTFTGNVSNSGTISAGGRGIGLGFKATTGAVYGVSTFTGNLSNSGTITAATGIYVFDSSIFTGNIGNSGTISAAATGIAVTGVSTFIGGITNSGAITAGAGIQIIRTSGSTVSISTFAGNITNSGTISASVGAGIQISSVVQFGTGSAGGISNSGIIAGVGDGISLSNISGFYGGIVNDTGGTISGYRAIEIDNGSLFAGGIDNRGTIIGVGSTAIRVSRMSTFQGGITNSGMIAGPTGIFIVNGSTFTGGISNSGTISAAGSEGIAVVSVAQFGTSSAGTGITNTGAIMAGATAILLRDVTRFAGGISNSGAIAGSKGIRVGWASTNAIAGVSTFLGGITNSGLISASSNEGITVEYVSTFSGGIANAAGGTISAASRGIAVSNLTTFSGDISNAGKITAATGIFIDSGVGFAPGSAIVNTGTIIGTTSAIDASAATSPVIIDINGGAISGNIVGAGIASGDTVNFALGSGSFTYADTIAGMQAVNINSGTLFDSGSITAAGVTVNSGGTLAPGQPNTTGTLSIAGSLTFNAGSGYQVMITNTGANSSTGVTGATTINGGTAEVKPLQFGHYNAATYTLLTASGGVTVNTPFAGPVFVGPFAYSGTATLTYPTDQVDLVLGPGYVDFAAPPGAGRNQQNVVAGINNYIINGGTLPTGFANLGNLSGPAYLSALTHLDGETATDAGKGATQLMTDFLNLMFDMSVEGRGGGGGAGGSASGFTDEEQASLPPDVALAYGSILKKPPPQNFDQRWSTWGSAFGGTAKTDGDPIVGSNTVTASDYGFAAGMDYHVTSQTLYGFALAGGGTNWSVAQNLGSGRSDAFQAGAYGITHAGPAYLAGAVAFANHWFTTNRIALGDDLTAKFQGQSYAARGEVGYRYAVPLTGYIIGVTPYAALQAQDFHTPRYSETDLTGGGLGLSYSAMSATDTRSELGARFDNVTVLDGMPLVLRGRVAWAHDWVSNPALGAVFETLPGSNFTVNGAGAAANSALTTAAAELHLTANWTAAAKFDGEFASTSQTYSGTGTLKYSW